MSIKIFIIITIYFTANIDCLKYRYDYLNHPQIQGWLKQNNIPATWHQARLRCHLEGIPILRMPISWAPGEPDNHEDKEQCIIMMPNGTFADVCCDELFPYFSYKKKSTSVSANVACGTVDSGYAYETMTGSCYKFHNHAQLWDRAYMTCQAEGAHLVTMDTAAETQVLKEMFSKYPASKIYGSNYMEYAFVGIRDWGDAGEWTTIHGQSVDHLVDTGIISWKDKQPDNRTLNGLGQSCGCIRSDGRLYDCWCHVRFAFICEKTPDSLQTEEVD